MDQQQNSCMILNRPRLYPQHSGILMHLDLLLFERKCRFVFQPNAVKFGISNSNFDCLYLRSLISLDMVSRSRSSFRYSSCTVPPCCNIRHVWRWTWLSVAPMHPTGHGTDTRFPRKFSPKFSMRILYENSVLLTFVLSSNDFRWDCISNLL